MLSAAFVYELPFGKGKKYAADNGGVVGALVGGWQVSTIFRYSSALPLYFRSELLQRAGPVPRGMHPGASSMRARCSPRTRAASIPAKGPLFNAAAFEPVSAFNYYIGKGNRVEDSVRGFGYHNQDLSFIKNTRFGGGTNLQIRFEVFNMWNWHMFYGGSEGLALCRSTPTSRARTSASGTGGVTDPRMLQLGIRFEF